MDQADMRTPDSFDMSLAHMVPKHYAIAAMLKEMNRSGVTGWYPTIYDTVAKRSLKGDDVERILRAAGDAGEIAEMTRTKRSRLGKHTTAFDILRMKREIITQMGASARKMAVLSLQRDTICVDGKEIDIRHGALGCSISEHVIERLYERERLGAHQLLDTVKKSLASIENAVGYIRAAGLAVNPYDPRDTIGINPGASCAVPFGQGLLLVRITRIDHHDAPATRFKLLGRHAKFTEGSLSNDRLAEATPVEGKQMTGLLVALGRTYLSFDYLRPEQRDYLALIEDELERHGPGAFSTEAGRVWMPHETQTPRRRIEPPPRLLAMLRAQPHPLSTQTAWRSSARDNRPKRRTIAGRAPDPWS